MTRLSVAAVLFILPALASGAASADGPRTLVSFPGVTQAAAHDGSHVAWIETTWELRVRTLRTGKQSLLRYTSQYEEETGGRSPRLVLDGDRALWLSVRGAGMGGTAEHVLTARQGQLRARVLASVKHSAASEYWLVLAAGDLAYGVPRVEMTDEWPCDECMYAVVGGGVWIVDDGVKRAVPGAPPSAVLARAGGRIALAPADDSPHEIPRVRARGDVEIRHSRTGAVITAFTPSGPPVALALSAKVAAVLVGTRAYGQPARLERYDPVSGRRLGVTHLQRGVTYDLDAAGSRIVFHDARTISMLDSRTGRVRVVARAPVGWRLVDVDLGGQTLVWAESRGDLYGTRRNSESRIRSLSLRSA